MEDVKHIDDRNKMLTNAFIKGNHKLKGKSNIKKTDEAINKLDKIFENSNFNIRQSNMKYKHLNTFLISSRVNKYNGQKGFGRKAIKRWGKEVSDELNSLGLKGYITTCLDFNGKVVRSGNQTPFGSDVNLCMDDDYEGSEILDGICQSVKNFKDVRYFIAIEPDVKPNIKKVKLGDSLKNDCLYNCLKKVMPQYIPWVKAEGLKKWLKIKRDEKIDTDRLPEIEKHLGVGINITGEFEYESMLESNLQIHLTVKNEHCEINPKPSRKVFNISYYEEKQFLMFIEYKKVYNGECVFELTDELHADIKAFKSKYILIPRFNLDLDYEEDYKAYVKIADTLKAETINSDFKINMYKTGSIKTTALKLLDDTTKHIMPEHTGYKEAMIIKEATNGAIIFADKYEGYGYKLDIVSMYPSILYDNNVLIPIKQGIFTTMTKIEFEQLKFLPFGIYKCQIEKSDDLKINRLFRFNKFNRYTQPSLKHAIKLGLKINIIEEENNVILYPRKNCVTAYQVFKNYIDVLFPLKQKGITGAKLLLNIITGALGEMNDRIIKVNEDGDTIVNIPDYYTIVDTTFVMKKNITKYHVVHENNYFKCRFCRFKPFLLATSRSIISNYIQPYKENIKKCSTDSMISDIKLHYELGINMGDLKLEKEYRNCKITSCRKEIDLDGV